MKRKKSGRQALVAYLCLFRPEPEDGVTVHLPQAAPGDYLWRNSGRSAGESAQAIELCLEVMREDGQPIPPPDRDLALPIDQLLPVADADT